MSLDPSELSLAYLLSIAQSRYAASAVDIASNTGTQIGDDIPDDKVRYVFGIVASSLDGSAQGLEIMQGDTTDNDRTTSILMDLASTGPTVLGKNDPREPILILRPNTAAGLTPVTRGNRIGIAHETSPINVTMAYVDLP